MRRASPAAVLLSVLLGVLFAGCGDPVAVLGDIPGLMRVVAGIPAAPGNTTEERATESRLNSPAGLVVAPDGMLYAADGENSRIVEISPAGEFRVVFDDRFCVTEPCLERPTGIALDADGRLVVADPEGNRVWRVNRRTGQAVVLAGTGERASVPDGAAASTAALAGPWGVAVGGNGTIYVTERLAHRVRTIRPNGTLGTVAGTGQAGFGGDGGQATAARLELPAGLALANGTLYIADESNDRVRAVDLGAGTIRTIAGNGARGFGGDGGPAGAAALNLPQEIAVTPEGDLLYIADTSNHRVRVVDLESRVITTFAGTGDPQFTEDFLDAGATSLRLPAGVATSSFGLLFVADTGHHVVWRVAVPF